MNDVQVTPAATQLKIVIVGHVDHGKSTLVGRLLHDTGSLPDGKLAQLRKVAESRGAPFEWANVMDALQSERDQNITIDTAQIWFRTERRQYVLIDAPGHKEFLKNMVTGAASAETALLLIDAHEGIRENSRRHGYLLGLLGIRQVAVLVNKMDLAGHRESRFREIETEYRAWLEEAGIAPCAFIPVAARHGDNIATRSASMPWYGGPTVVETLDAFEAPDPLYGRPLRFPIQDIYRFDERRIFVGRVESGTLRVGDRLVFSPSDTTSTVRSIERWNAASRDHASAKECVGITLTEQVFVERGAIAAHEGMAPFESTLLRGRVLWLDRQPLREGNRYKLKLATAEADCVVERIERVIDASMLGDSAGGDFRLVRRHEVAELTFRARKPVAFDAFSEIAPTGRFVIVDGFDVVGAGIVATGRPPKQCASEIRVRHNTHSGCVLWLTGPSGAGKRTLAAELERELFSRGRHAVVLDGDTLHGGLCSDLALGARDRDEKTRRVGEVAKLFDAAGVICISALLLPQREERARVRQLLPEGRFVEVHVNAAPEICEQRSGNGGSGTARAFAYEPPPAPEIEIRTDRLTVSESVLKILEYLHLP
jgi:bifunctional enzyme CysN/CysC